MSGYQKKLVWPTNKASFGVCYRLLCNNLEDGIVCTLSPNQEVHSQGKWYLSAMDNVFFEVKKCMENAFSRDLEIQIYWLSKQNSKKNSIFGKKTAVDKSAWIKVWYICIIYICIMSLFIWSSFSCFWNF